MSPRQILPPPMCPSLSVLPPPKTHTQAPDLTLVPAVAAPGAYIQVKTMTDEATYVSGTSFSSPYTAGLIAMWLQVWGGAWGGVPGGAAGTQKGGNV